VDNKNNWHDHALAGGFLVDSMAGHLGGAFTKTCVITPLTLDKWPFNW
jgi:hypothetical protein